MALDEKDLTKQSFDKTITSVNCLCLPYGHHQSWAAFHLLVAFLIGCRDCWKHTGYSGVYHPERWATLPFFRNDSQVSTSYLDPKKNVHFWSLEDIWSAFFRAVVLGWEYGWWKQEKISNTEGIRHCFNLDPGQWDFLNKFVSTLRPSCFLLLR